MFLVKSDFYIVINLIFKEVQFLKGLQMGTWHEFFFFFFLFFLETNVHEFKKYRWQNFEEDILLEYNKSWFMSLYFKPQFVFSKSSRVLAMICQWFLTFKSMYPSLYFMKFTVPSKNAPPE